MSGKFEHPANKRNARRSKLIRSLNKLRYLKSDLEYHKTEQIQRKINFDADIIVYMKRNDLSFSPNKQKTGLIVDDHVTRQKQDAITEEIKKECKTLYKKIAKQAHPDVNLDKDVEMQNLREIIFQNARKAFDTNDWFSLYDYALDLDIELPIPTDSQIKWLEAESEKLEEVIKLVESSFEWIYGEKQTKAEKENILIKYCLMFCYDKNN
tara:strand:- start:1086 stop:1715 length:630 start_codon:yes stop_codon:yes gene_type:complete